MQFYNETINGKDDETCIGWMFFEKSDRPWERIQDVEPGELWILQDAERADFEGLAEKLTQEGCRMYDSHAEGEIQYAVLDADDAVLTAAYLPQRRMVRLAAQRGEKLPLRETGEAICKPLLTQVKLSYFSDDCGMAYILRLEDGRFLCIDGGLGMYDDAKLLYNVLKEQNVLPKIRIAAWFITHPHDDHIEGFASLMRDHGSDIELEHLLFHWPRPDLTGRYSNMERFNAVIEGLSDRIMTPQSGQRFNFPGARVDVLYTCNDLYPERFENINDSSMVMRIEMAGRRILITGDIQQQATAEICDRYGRESLQAEFLQVPHHGYWGGSTEFFSRVDPQIVLWPCPNMYYSVIRDFDCNRYLKESPDIRQIFVGGRQQVTLDMTEAVPEIKMASLEGPVLLEQKFESGSMVELGFTCVADGPGKCKAPRLEFPEKGCCRLTAQGRAAVELLQPEQLGSTRHITVEIQGKLLSGELAALWWNHPIPMMWPEVDRFIPLANEDSGVINVKFDFDRSCAEHCGLYLVLEASQVELNWIRVCSSSPEGEEKNETE